MSDPRPSDTQDDYPKFPALVAQFGQTFEPPVAADPIEDWVERAVNVNSPEQALVYAQLATVRAIQALTATLLHEVTR